MNNILKPTVAVKETESSDVCVTDSITSLPAITSDGHSTDKFTSMETVLSDVHVTDSVTSLPAKSINSKTRAKIVNFLSTCSGEEIFHIFSQIPSLNEIDVVAAITAYKKSLKADVRAYLNRHSQQSQRNTLTQQLIHRYGDVISELRQKMSADKLAQYLRAFEGQSKIPNKNLKKITPAMIRAAFKKLHESSDNQ